MVAGFLTLFVTRFLVVKSQSKLVLWFGGPVIFLVVAHGSLL